jgi:hypothetical protein
MNLLEYLNMRAEWLFDTIVELNRAGVLVINDSMGCFSGEELKEDGYCQDNTHKQ